MGLNTDVIFGHFQDNIFSRMQASDKQKYEFWSDPERYKKNPRHSLAEIVRAMIPGCFYDRQKSLLVSGVIKDSDFNFTAMGNLIWADVKARNLDLTKMERRYSGPVLILHGRQDPLGESVPHSLASYYDQSKLVFIEKAGHYSLIEQPKEIMEHLKHISK